MEIEVAYRGGITMEISLGWKIWGSGLIKSNPSIRRGRKCHYGEGICWGWGG
jgi:hypothetical protein